MRGTITAVEYDRLSGRVTARVDGVRVCAWVTPPVEELDLDWLYPQLRVSAERAG